MKLYLVRHGESTNNAGVDHVLESPLTELGEAQADRAGAWLADKGIGRLYTSLMLRALQTADILSRHLNVSPRAFSHLCERRVDEAYVGLSRTEIAGQFPACDLPDDLTEDGWWDRSIETEEALYSRARTAARTLLDLHAHTDDRAVLVTHGIFASVFMSVLFDLPPIGYKRFPMDNAAISRFDISGDIIELVLHNYTDHLPRDIRTEGRVKTATRYLSET